MIIENESRELFNPETKVIDFRKVKATDLRDNPRVILPKPRPPGEEIELLVQRQIWQTTIEKYAENHCNSKGDQKQSNLTNSQKIGMSKLKNRSKDGSIVIGETDKSNKTTISSRESYTKQGEVHTSKDRFASWEEIRETKNLVLCHTKALINVFKVGSSHPEHEETRVRENMMENLTVIPQASLMQKDHKPLNPDGTPKTRFLCHASTTYNQRLSDLTNDICKGMIDSDSTEELIISEDFLSIVEETNKLIKDGKIDSEDLVIGSLDVENLYGSINVSKASEVVRERAL